MEREYEKRQRIEAAREKEWLEQLKVGDEVAIRYWGGWGDNTYHFCAITDETPTLWKINSRQFYKKDGKERGPYCKTDIKEPTTELKADIADRTRRIELIRLLDQTAWGSLPTTTLETVNAILRPESKSASQPT